jgi:hypothetical protein
VAVLQQNAVVLTPVTCSLKAVVLLLLRHVHVSSRCGIVGKGLAGLLFPDVVQHALEAAC